ncbi:hypothetical protein HDE_09376 [Halotydeus destructor]|nr:hypothetical protein HDE_09376 [Halotydeus destructor]
MAWISSCVDFFRTALVFSCDLLELCTEFEALKVSPGSKLYLTELPEDVLIRIFKCLEIEHLVRLERVSKQFFRIVSSTFLELKHITRRDVEATGFRREPEARPKFDPISFINRFGSSLRTLPFEMFIPLLESFQCDTSYCKRLAWRFPEISDVDVVDEDTIDWLLVFVNAMNWKCKLRKMHVHCDLRQAHMFDRTIFTKLKLKLIVIISQCYEFDKLVLQLDTDFCAALDQSLTDRSVSDFGKLVFELSSKVKRLVLIDKAVEAMTQYTSLGPVNLQALELVLFEPDHLSNTDVLKFSRFAPHVRTLSIRADVTALKHLTALDKLENVYIETKQDNGQLRDLRKSDSCSVKKFFENRGSSLKRAKFVLVDSKQAIPIVSWLSKYCQNLTELTLVIHGKQELKLLKFSNLIQFDFVMFYVSEADLEMLLDSNPKLQRLRLIFVKIQALETSRAYFETRAKSTERRMRCLTVQLELDNNVASSLGISTGSPTYRFTF